MSNCDSLCLILVTFFTIIIINKTQIKYRIDYIVNNKLYSKEDFEGCPLENNKTLEDSKSKKSFYNNTYSEYNKNFNKTWRGLNQDDYIFNSNTKKYINNILSSEKEELRKELPIKDFNKPFSKYDTLYSSISKDKLKNNYSFSNSYNPESEIRTIKYSDIDKIVFKVDPEKRDLRQTPPKSINNINAGNIVKLKNSSDVRVKKIYLKEEENKSLEDHMLDTVPDFIDYNVSPILENNTNKV